MKNPVSATLQGLLETMRGTSQRVPSLTTDERLDGRVALVTGGNRGLGKSIAVQLAQRGAHVIMACRTGIPEAGEEVKRASGSGAVDMRSLDLADLFSVVEFVKGLARDGVKIDVLVLNAGVVPREARPTAQGFELMFGVNYLANVALVERMLSEGVIRFGGAHKPRIVFVSSDTHRGAGPVDFERLGHFESYGALGGVKVYGYTKLLFSVYAAHLARRLGSTAAVHSCCPGAVNTDIAREAPEWVKPVLSRVMQHFFRPPEEAAESIMVLACAREFEQGIHRYLHAMVEKAPDRECQKPELSERLFRETEVMIARALGEPVRGAA
jgi:NAD(P)-dependent dehydrogenase (short-subunit alcohol dehydrogenase family)